MLSFAVSHPNQIDASVAKPGLILQPGSMLHWLRATVLWWIASVPSISVVETSAAMLEQVLDGFEKDTLMNNDLVRIGQKALSSNNS